MSKNKQRSWVLENGKIVSNTHYYRLKKAALILGCKMHEVPDTRGKHKNHSRGEKHYKFNDNKISTDGYKLIIVGLGHPLDIGNGYTYEHRYLKSLEIGRWLSSEEIVHHKDENKLNNDLNNLEILSRKDHNKYHAITTIDRSLITGRFLKKASGNLLDGVEYKNFPVI
ncbi:MAG: HNH endonuclease [Chitinophagales bacterium]